MLAGRFGLVDLLGEGGMSRVYKAVDMRKVEAGADDPHVAVKVLTIAFDDYTDAVALLHRELDNLRDLTHPNIVRVIDFDRDGATVFMTMELLRGRTLAEILRTPHFEGVTRAEALPIIENIANALQFAHERRLVHGDLKPGNVMITETGAAKVIDFGIARAVAQPISKLARRPPRRSSVSGLTPAYASPEMLEDKAPDPRDDVYALACMAWEIMTGRHPFDRIQATLARDGADTRYAVGGGAVSRRHLPRLSDVPIDDRSAARRARAGHKRSRRGRIGRGAERASSHELRVMERCAGVHAVVIRANEAALPIAERIRVGIRGARRCA